MVRFIPAAELKSKFDVFGHFYSVQVAAKKVVECRSVLEIVGADPAPMKTADLSRRKPDAVFIMMNPQAVAYIRFSSKAQVCER